MARQAATEESVGSSRNSSSPRGKTLLQKVKIGNCSSPAAAAPRRSSPRMAMCAGRSGRPLGLFSSSSFLCSSAVQLPKFPFFCARRANGLLQRILLPNPLLSHKTTTPLCYTQKLKETILDRRQQDNRLPFLYLLKKKNKNGKRYDHK